VARKYHGWALFQKTKIGKKTMNGALLPYKLISDLAYPMHPWFYSPFEGKKNGLFQKKARRNFE
jgi:hypothetical protein